MIHEVHEAVKQRCGFGFAARATCWVLTNNMSAASLRKSGVNVSSGDITGSCSLFSENFCCTLVSSSQKEHCFQSPMLIFLFFPEPLALNSRTREEHLVCGRLAGADGSSSN